MQQDRRDAAQADRHDVDLLQAREVGERTGEELVGEQDDAVGAARRDEHRSGCDAGDRRRARPRVAPAGDDRRRGRPVPVEGVEAQHRVAGIR
ncbi:hypothetical protein REH70_05995 [Cellulomonas sp. ATA003]|nr:hypothetical protein [Cellulomonas sp. ATA003]WNB86764.1 hypothetical protein REH70_05995 [Cellulomonas sp. ATA003]